MTKLARLGGRGPLTERGWGSRVRAWLADKASDTKSAYGRDWADFARWAEAPSLAAAATELFAGEPHEVRVRVQETFLAYAADLTTRPVWRSSKAREGAEEPLKYGLAKATVARRLAALRALVTLAQSAGRCPEVTLPKAPTVRKFRDTRGIGRTAYLTMLDAIDAHLDAAEKGSKAHATAVRDRAILRLLHDGGLRRIEVVRLRFRDVAPDFSHIKVWGKGADADERVDWPLSKAMAEALQAWLLLRGPGEGALFSARPNSRKPLHPNTLNKALTRWAERSGLPRATPHQMRHTAGTMIAIRTGGNPIAVQRFLRHKNVRTSMDYVDNLGDDVRQMQEMLGDGEDDEA